MRQPPTWLPWGIVAVLGLVIIYLGFFSGEWKPVGDGRSIIHTRSVEIMDVTTGMSPTESHSAATMKRRERFLRDEIQELRDTLEKERAAYARGHSSHVAPPPRPVIRYEDVYPEKPR